MSSKKKTEYLQRRKEDNESDRKQMERLQDDLSHAATDIYGYKALLEYYLSEWIKVALPLVKLADPKTIKTFIKLRDDSQKLLANLKDERMKGWQDFPDLEKIYTEEPESRV